MTELYRNQSQKFFNVGNRLLKAVCLGILCGLVSACTSSGELEWNQQQGYRWAELSPGYFGETGFKSLSSSQTNIQFENQITDQEIAENRHYLNGSGVAAGDVNGDGLTDVYFSGLNTPNKLYLNQGGLEFQDITDQAGVAHEGYYSTGAVFADVDGDSDMDLLVTAMHKQNVLYRNDGSGNFTLDTESGLGDSHGSMTMALADIDRDGDLDLYLTNYKEQSIKDVYTTEELEWNSILQEEYSEQNQTGPFTLVPPFDEHYQLFYDDNNTLVGAAETGRADELYLNEGGSFQKVENTEEVFLNQQGNPMGLQPDWGLTAKFQDLNNDGLPDLYVCNDFFPKDRIWMNQGDGTFRAKEAPAIRNMSFSAMAVDFADINRDNRLDMFVTEMLSPRHERRLRQMGSDDPTPNRVDEIMAIPQYNRNSMYLKREDETYAEIAYLTNTEATEWSWATRFMDINLDGFEDLIINTGYTYDILDIDTQAGMIREGRNMDENFDVLLGRAPSLAVTNKFLMNNGDLSFRDRSAEWGFNDEDVAHGLATADLDNDGDLDFASNRLNSPAIIFENTINKPRIAVRLKGEAPNINGIGAEVRLIQGESRQQKQVASGGDYLSSSAPEVMFAADADQNYTLEVSWPDGKRSTIPDVVANRIYEISKETAEIVKEPVESSVNSPALFQETSQKITYTHREQPFDESGLQPLLPATLSRQGPGVTWLDIDSDGDDDLLIAAGKGSAMGLFENLGDGNFEPMDQNMLTQAAPGDQTTIVGWSTGQGTQLLVGSANYEQGSPQVPSVYHYLMSDSGNQQKGTLSNYSTSGPIAAADYDNDGDIDLFLGGRFVPAFYPRNATSRLFKNENGTFVVDEMNSRKLGEIGLITGAVFSDIDTDGDQDLVLSREWDSVMLMENDAGVFNDVSSQVGLEQYKGWWNGVSTGDFNGDGQPDIVATNWGQNSFYQLRNDRPLRFYYDDFNGDRRVDIIETHADGEGNYVPMKRLYQYNSLPIISNRIESYQRFANTTMQDLFGNQLSRVPYKEVNTLQHLVFINRGNAFEARSLPKEAQFSAGFHPAVADFNNDGNEDLFLSQNFFVLPRQVPRLDAGRGLLMQGDGDGNFEPVSGTTSGIKIYGEQRGAAISDFNRDGKTDLAVSQNNAPVKLFVNQIDKTGYRVTLQGPPANSDGVGSAVRLVYANGDKGPLREIQAGSGYWSQSSFTQVLGVESGRQVGSIEVHWFDGRSQSIEVDEGKKEYRIPLPGQ